MPDWEDFLDERARLRLEMLRHQHVKLVWRTKPPAHDGGRAVHHLYLEARMLEGGRRLGRTGPAQYREETKANVINRMVISVLGQAMHTLYSAP